MTQVNINDYHEINKGALKARFNVHIPEWHLVIRDMSHFVQGNKQWVSFPARQYEQDGQKKYFAFLLFDDKEVKEAFNHACLEAIKLLHPQPMEQPEQSGNSGQMDDSVPF